MENGVISMKEYEIVAKFCNACAGSSRPQTFFEEAELENTDDYVRMKHSKDFAQFLKTKKIICYLYWLSGKLHIERIPKTVSLIGGD